MTSGRVARARRREGAAETPLPPALRAELRARVQDAASRRVRIIDEAKRQRRTAERTAAETYERIRSSAQDAFERERAEIRAYVDEQAARA